MPQQPAMPTPVRPPPPDLRWLRRRDVWGAVLGLLAALSALALLTIIRGVVGAGIVRFWRSLLGWGAYPVVALLLASAAWLVLPGHLAARIHVRPAQAVGVELFLLASLSLLHIPFATAEGYVLATRGGGGGYVGWTLVYLLVRALGRLPGGLLLGLAAVAGAALAADLPWGLLRAAVHRQRAAPPPYPAPSPALRVQPVSQGVPAAAQPRAAPTLPSPAGEPAKPRPTAPKPAAAPAPRPPRRRVRSSRLPSLDILAPASPLSGDDAEVRYQVQVIEETLAHFGVPATVADVQRGPTVTQYGVEPGFVERRGLGGQVERRKVRVSRIANLANDLALALAAPSIRIEAPVPGRPLVGIEVPNRKATMVGLRSVMESDSFRRIRSSLRVALGHDVSGRPVAADLATMPHLLIAGATGSGKSVCINALIACLLMENSPEALNLVLIDPKRVELTGFAGVPHLVAPVVVEVEQIVGALRWLCQEMDRRYKEFSRRKVRHIEGYNAAVGPRKAERLPYLAVFVDELADLMMVAPDEVERALCRLAQMGRATGIHLVVATQRPSIDVVTGLIKANFPARIAFAVSTQVDSRVILDAAGAEQLLGRGDMLFMAPDANRLHRLQGCFVSDAELAAIAGYWRQATEGDSEQEEATPPWHGLATADDDEDPLLSQALELIREQKQASASFFQRRLRIGYARAARLMDELQERGLVGPDPGGGRPRQVLASSPAAAETESDEAEA